MERMCCGTKPYTVPYSTPHIVKYLTSGKWHEKTQTVLIITSNNVQFSFHFFSWIWECETNWRWKRVRICWMLYAAAVCLFPTSSHPLSVDTENLMMLLCTTSVQCSMSIFWNGFRVKIAWYMFFDDVDDDEDNYSNDIDDSCQSVAAAVSLAPAMLVWMWWGYVCVLIASVIKFQDNDGDNDDTNIQTR